MYGLKGEQGSVRILVDGSYLDSVVAKAVTKRMKEIAIKHHVCLRHFIEHHQINHSTILEVQSIYCFCDFCGISLEDFFNSEVFNR